MATAGLILGIIGFLTSFFLVGMLFSAAGLALSALSMSKKGGTKALLGVLFSLAGLLLPTILIGSYINAPPEQKAAMQETVASVFNIDPSLFGKSDDQGEMTSLSDNDAAFDLASVSDDSVSSEADEDADDEDNDKDRNEHENTDSDGLSKSVSTDYTIPSEDNLEIPDTVAEKTGLDDIEEEVETVDDETADKIEDELPTGPTGDDLTFDPEFYPYYDMIDDNSKALYRQIYANADIQNSQFKAVNKDISRKELSNAFEAVFYDHPELFWLNTAYSASYRKNGDCLAIDLSFNSTAKNIDSSKEKFNSAAEEILTNAKNLGSEYEKEKYVHDSLAELDDYSLSAPLNQSAYSSLVNGSTVCAGYARAFQYLMQELDVPTYFCAGYAGEAHAWDIIKLEDDYYNVDVTWDDTGDEKICNYDYFNKTDDDYASNHARRTLSVYLPACNGEKYRNLEPDEEENSEDSIDEESSDEDLPGIEDYGFSEDEVLKDLESYYDDAYEQIMSKGKGSYHIYDVIEGDELYETLRNAYNSKTASNDLLERVLADLDADAVNISIQPQELSNGRYLLDHTISVY